MRILPCRRAFGIVETKRSGLSAAMESAIDLVKAFTAGHSAFGLIGETTCRPLPPEVLTNDARPTFFNRAWTSSAAAVTDVQATSSPGSRSITIMSGHSQSVTVDPQ